MRQMYIWHIDVFQLVIKVVKLRMKLMIEFRYKGSIENQNNLFHFKCKYSNVKFEMFIRTCESCLNVISPLRQQEGEENEVMFSMLFSWVTTGIDSYCMVHNIEHSLIPILSWLGKHQIFFSSFSIMSESTTTCFFAKVLYSLTKVNVCKIFKSAGVLLNSKRKPFHLCIPLDITELIVCISHWDCAVTGPSVNLVFISEEKSKAFNRKGKLVLFF